MPKPPPIEMVVNEHQGKYSENPSECISADDTESKKDCRLDRFS